MYLLNNRCEKSILEEVQFYFESYQEFISSSNQKLIAVLSALNTANMGRYNDLRVRYPGFLLDPEPIDINKLTALVQSIFPAQVLRYNLGDSTKNAASSQPDVINENKEEVGLFPQKGKKLETPNKDSSNHHNANNLNEHLDEHQAEHLTQEDNEDLQERGSYQPPDRNSEKWRGRSRSPESISNRDTYRYEVTDRRYRSDHYDTGFNNSDNYQLNSFQWMEARLFVDKITYFNGSTQKYYRVCSER